VSGRTRRGHRRPLSRVPTCNLCGFPVLRLHPGSAGQRCLRCLSTFRHRAVGAVLAGLGLGRNVDVYELSSRGALCRYLRRTFARVTVSELFDDVPPGGYRNGVQCQDVQRLTYDAATFDLVTSTEVFEHVPDDLRAFTEVHRVLRDGGFLVFTVPLMDVDDTLVRARLHDGTIEHLVEPEYHGDRLRGRAGVLAFRTYGLDILGRLRTAGFEPRLERIDDHAHAIADGKVLIARKPA
jgi:SAM-dependent methyltransferase